MEDDLAAQLSFLSPAWLHRIRTPALLSWTRVLGLHLSHPPHLPSPGYTSPLKASAVSIAHECWDEGIRYFSDMCKPRVWSERVCCPLAGRLGLKGASSPV